MSEALLPSTNGDTEADAPATAPAMAATHIDIRHEQWTVADHRAAATAAAAAAVRAERTGTIN